MVLPKNETLDKDEFLAFIPRQLQYMLLVTVTAILASLMKWAVNYIPKVINNPCRQGMNKQGKELVGCRRVITIVTISMASVISSLQLIMIFLDFVIPPAYFIDCNTFLNALFLLHPCINFTTLYVMIFIRQFFTFRALRETRLREFISAVLLVVSMAVGCTFIIIIFVIAGLLYYFPNQFDSNNQTTTECLTHSKVSMPIIYTTGFGNLVIVLFFCFWTAYPIYKYLRFRQKNSDHQGSSSTNAKYVEVIMLQGICVLTNLCPSLAVIPIMAVYDSLCVFIISTWILYYPLLFLIFLPEGDFRSHIKLNYLDDIIHTKRLLKFFNIEPTPRDRNQNAPCCTLTSLAVDASMLSNLREKVKNPELVEIDILPKQTQAIRENLSNPDK